MSNLPATLTSLAAGLQASAQDVAANDVTFMKFTAGDWCYGAEETAIEPDSTWAVHPEFLMHGWVAWGDDAHDNAGKIQGEKMVPAGQPKPTRASLPEVQAEWANQYGIQMLCLEGYDLGLAVMYKSSSYGGGKVFKKLLTAIVAKIQSGSDEICPVLMLSGSDYKHAKYGKTYNPEIEIVDWMSIEDLANRSGVMAADNEVESEQNGMIDGGDMHEQAEIEQEDGEVIETETETEPEPETETEPEPVKEEKPKRARSERKTEKTVAKSAKETADTADTTAARSRPERSRRRR